jgi:hypothetical protein
MTTGMGRALGLRTSRSYRALSSTARSAYWTLSSGEVRFQRMPSSLLTSGMLMLLLAARITFRSVSQKHM